MIPVRILDDQGALARAAAAEISAALAEAVAERGGPAHLALSGGGTPRPTYELLAGDPALAAVELWMVDERCVAPEHEESNWRLVTETMLAGGGPIGNAPRHRMRGELGPERGALDYQRELGEHVPRDPRGLPMLDVAVLGIGPDGHVASLFPDRAALTVEPPAACVGVCDSPKPPPERVSLTLPVLRLARRCVLIVSGSEKAHALGLALLGKPTTRVPASLLARERLVVLADREAAAELPS